MKKGLFLFRGIDLTDESCGIRKKILSQVDILRVEGFDTTLYCIENRKTSIIKGLRFIPSFGKIFNKKELINLEVMLKSVKFDFVYFRKSTIDSLEIQVLALLKKYKVKIIYELPTYPFHNEYFGIKRVFVIMMKYFEKKIKKYVDRIVTFSKDSYIFKVKTLKIPNCIDGEQIIPRRIEKHNGVNVIAVANFSFWHGYDRFILGLSDYYKGNYKREVKLYMVGEGALLEKYINLVKTKNLEKYVIFCGKQTGEALDKIYDISDIALDAMGRHRARVYYNSSLKGKEYAAKGLPIISGVETEFDQIENFPYYLRVNADDSTIDINVVLKFYDEVYTNSEGFEITNSIRKTCLEKFDYKKGYKTIIDYLGSSL